MSLYRFRFARAARNDCERSAEFWAELAKRSRDAAERSANPEVIGHAPELLALAKHADEIATELRAVEGVVARMEVRAHGREQTDELARTGQIARNA